MSSPSRPNIPAADPATTGPDWLSGEGDMPRRFRELDWTTTPFGPPETWPSELKVAVKVCLQSLHPIVMYWGPDFHLLYNDAWAPILGNKHPYGLGRSAREIWAEIWEGFGADLERIRSSGRALWFEDQLLALHRFGFTEEAYFSYSPTPVKDDAGNVQGLLTPVTETTLKVIGERRLRTLKDLSGRPLEASTDVEALESAAQVLRANTYDFPFFALYLSEGDTARLIATGGLESGATAAPEAIALGDENAVWPLGRAQFQRFDVTLSDDERRAALPGGPWPETPRQASILPLAKAGSAPFGFLVAGISARLQFDSAYADFLSLTADPLSTAIRNARALEEEQRRAEELAALDREKTRFFSNVSHEFRTPLTLMLGPAQDALEDTSEALGGLQRERMEIVHRNAQRLLKLVNALLDFSRIEAGRLTAHPEPTHLPQYTADLASNFRSLMERAGLELVVDCPPLPFPVLVDRGVWEKILLNLLSNAFKFTFEGRVRVGLTANVGKGWLELRVEDTGTGIPAAQLPHLFERFHRVEGAKGRSFEGSGIGLALVQELARLSGGEVRVESEVGKGTAFIVQFPLERADEGAAKTAQSASTPGPQSQGYLAEASQWLLGEEEGTTEGAFEPQGFAGPTGRSAKAPRARVLLVDDNADMREYVERTLGDRYEVESVANGLLALEATRRQVPVAIISDVMMPGLDGFGLLRALQAEPTTSHVPVILLSARAGEEATVEGLSAGAADYLVKPFSARELIGRVDAVVKAAEAETFRRELLERERRAREEAEEANRLKDEFMATVSHELRTPLTSMLGWVQMLRMGQVAGDKIPKALEIIERNTRAQAQLVEDLLDIARISAGKLALDLQLLSFATPLEAALDTVRAAAEAKQIELSVMVDPTLQVRGDADRLQQVAWNLLANAVKFTPRGGRVRVSLFKEGSNAELVVTDNGQGIPPEFLPHVFERFRQAEGSSRRSFGGLGLGLSIVRHLVETHGGNVRAQSAGVGLGASFSVRLPLTAVKENSASPREVAPPLHPDGFPSARTFDFPPELRGRSVLIVDDEPDTRELLGALLLQGGLRVETAGSAGEALELMTRFRPDLLISDIGMPGADGYELIQRVRALPRESGGATPALALTAYARTEDRTRALRAGYWAHLSKPLEPSELLAVLATLIPRQHAAN